MPNHNPADDSDSSIDDLHTTNPVEESNADLGEADTTEQSKCERFERLDIWEQWTEVIQDLKNDPKTWGELQDYKKQALIARDSREPKTPTFLHNMTKIKHFNKISIELKRKIVEYILRNGKSYATVERSGVTEDPILKVAMEYCTSEFFQTLVDCVEKENMLDKFISATASDQMNCIHYGFREQMRAARRIDNFKSHWSPEETFNVLKYFVKKAPPPALVAIDRLGNTPLHYAVDYSLCHWNERNYPKLIKLLVKRSEGLFSDNPDYQFNKNGESPYRYFVATQSSFSKRRMPAPPEDPNKDFTKRLNSNDKEIEEMKGRKDKDLGNYEANATASSANSAPKIKELRRKPGAVSTDPRHKRGRQLSISNDASNHQTYGSHQSEANGLMLPPPPPNVSVTQPKASEVRGDSRVRQGLSRKGTQNISSVATPSEIHPDHDTPTDTEEVVAVPQGDLAAEQFAKDIGDHLKDHYIRKRCDVEAKELLYGKASDRNLYLDCDHLRGVSIDEVIKLIEALSEAGGFEDTLSYVSLPLLTGCHDKVRTPKSNKVPIANEKRSRNGSNRETLRSDCNMLIKVFDALVNANVRRIVRLQVEDRVECPHEDTAIERAILGKVDFCFSLDWRKPDLGIDVILFAAPRVEHVTLYWSGSPVVLNAWGSSTALKRNDGKQDNTKSSNLKSITLQAFTGNESPVRVEKLIEQLEALSNPKSGGKTENPDNKRFLKTVMNYQPILFSPDSHGDGDITDGVSNRSNDYKWIDRMDSFRSALISIHKGFRFTGYPETKIVLIDDGVGLPTLDGYGVLKPLRGMSYPPRNGEKELPWYQSANGHGTTMAKMIVRINPFVLLYVIRIHETTSYTSGVVKRSIFARSAGDAIEAAIQKRPDIISMSWTIKRFIKEVKQDSYQTEKKSADEDDIDFLADAIKKAKAKGILMFCSASDNIEHRAMESLPYSAAPESIFRIGSATSSGQRDALSEDRQHINYFFPGINVGESRNPRSTAPIQYHDGSSVATALAAGLASLILHCTRVLAHCSENKIANQQLFCDLAKKLPLPEHMKTAFNSIHEGKTEADDPKFLPVWIQFKEDYSKTIKNSLSHDEKLKILERIIKNICRKVGVQD